MIVTQDPVNNSILDLHLHTLITKGDQIVFNVEIVECSSLDHDLITLCGQVMIELTNCPFFKAEHSLST